MRQRNTCRRASSLVPGTKKEELPESQLPYSGAKETKLAGEPFRLCREQRKRTCRRASSLTLGTKKKDLPESQFAGPGDKAGGPAGEPVRLSWGVKSQPNRRFENIRFDVKPGLRTVFAGFALLELREKEDLPERADEERRLAGEPVRLSWGQRRRTCRRASSVSCPTEDLKTSDLQR